MAKKAEKPIKDDPRVKELAQCVCFAIRAFRNKPIFNNETSKMESWHQWFKRALTEAGYTLHESTNGK